MRIAEWVIVGLQFAIRDPQSAITAVPLELESLVDVGGVFRAMFARNPPWEDLCLIDGKYVSMARSFQREMEGSWPK